MLLAHTVMSEAQWEKFYWPSLKRLLDAAAAKKKSVRLTVEGSLPGSSGTSLTTPRAS